MASLLRSSCQIFSKFARNVRVLPSMRHTSTMGDDTGEYEHMKTSVNFVNQSKQGIYIDAYSSHGFKLSTGTRVIGPCVVFPKSILHWNVSGVEGINKESLSLFGVLEPKLDILVIGIGEREDLGKMSNEAYQYLRSKKINVEVLVTDQALATFNFLNSEGRYVAGAFIPPSYVDQFEEDDVTDPNLMGLGAGDWVMGNEKMVLQEDDVVLEIERPKRRKTDEDKSKTSKEPEKYME